MHLCHLIGTLCIAKGFGVDLLMRSSLVMSLHGLGFSPMVTAAAPVLPCLTRVFSASPSLPAPLTSLLPEVAPASAKHLELGTCALGTPAEGAEVLNLEIVFSSTELSVSSFFGTQPVLLLCWSNTLTTGMSPLWLSADFSQLKTVALGGTAERAGLSGLVQVASLDKFIAGSS